MQKWMNADIKNLRNKKSHHSGKPCSLNFKVDANFRAWLAGLIDGEGCFSINIKTGAPDIILALTENDKFVLEYIVSNIGGKLYYRKPTKGWKPNWKPQWFWRLFTYNDCVEFGKWILPYLVLKHVTALKFLEVLEK